jgi:hypothetical protein
MREFLPSSRYKKLALNHCMQDGPYTAAVSICVGDDSLDGVAI